MFHSNEKWSIPGIPKLGYMHPWWYICQLKEYIQG